MNYNACQNCGIENLQTAEKCLRCGFIFSQSVNASDAPKTIESVAVQSKGNNSKLYWIMGGLGALVIIGGLFIGVVAIGIYFYASSQKVPEVKKVENVNKNPVSPPVKPSPTPAATRANTSFSSEELKLIMIARSPIGKFTLLNTFPIPDSPEKKIFRNSGGEVSAMYAGESEKETVIYSIASYASSEKAQEEFRNFIVREKKGGAKMIEDIKVDTRNTSINASY